MGKPGLVNADPEGESWLVKIKVEDGESALEGLLDQAAYEEFISQ